MHGPILGRYMNYWKNKDSWSKGVAPQGSYNIIHFIHVGQRGCELHLQFVNGTTRTLVAPTKGVLSISLCWLFFSFFLPDFQNEAHRHWLSRFMLGCLIYLTSCLSQNERINTEIANQWKRFIYLRKKWFEDIHSAAESQQKVKNLEAAGHKVRSKLSCWQLLDIVIWWTNSWGLE